MFLGERKRKIVVSEEKSGHVDKEMDHKMQSPSDRNLLDHLQSVRQASNMDLLAAASNQNVLRTIKEKNPGQEMR